MNYATNEQLDLLQSHMKEVDDSHFRYVNNQISNFTRIVIVLTLMGVFNIWYNSYNISRLRQQLQILQEQVDSQQTDIAALMFNANLKKETAK